MVAPVSRQRQRRLGVNLDAILGDSEADLEGFVGGEDWGPPGGRVCGGG